MLNLIRNPNINSNHLFRADISLEAPFTSELQNGSGILPRITQFKSYHLKTVIVRTLIPRNFLVDRPLDQTCLIYQDIKDSGEIRSLVIYLPHIASAAECPFYHPPVQGIAFLHDFSPQIQAGCISIYYSFFESEPRTTKLERTALHLLAVIHKHGQGTAAGYVKRVQHDLILPQAIVQNTYARLKAKYAKTLIDNWIEVTDPGKHVFEDLSITAFLIELWADMYKDTDFPGFVDIGCGNGLLVHILLEEGYSGWGFDARRRKSWDHYSLKAQNSLKELVLIPSILPNSCSSKTSTRNSNSAGSKPMDMTASRGEASVVHSEIPVHQTNNIQEQIQASRIHNGTFPKGTFIISNHADELTPWTPILATLSECPFIMIPCCSHDLSGARFRAPPPKGTSVSNSAYASLVSWMSKLAEDCGWRIENEMLRIPSTRNTALIGRHREKTLQSVELLELVAMYGGAEGWRENALKLAKGVARNH
ncbi:hypothetical protein B7494_g6148 [Chlorociboria aeruginascens]|nr:hypothetical protein B7494_g6148 [Chlorociboria aeruginascens]